MDSIRCGFVYIAHIIWFNLSKYKNKKSKQILKLGLPYFSTLSWPNSMFNKGTTDYRPSEDTWNVEWTKLFFCANPSQPFFIFRIGSPMSLLPPAHARKMRKLISFIRHSMYLHSVCKHQVSYLGSSSPSRIQANITISWTASMATWVKFVFFWFFQVLLNWISTGFLINCVVDQGEIDNLLVSINWWIWWASNKFKSGAWTNCELTKGFLN